MKNTANSAKHKAPVLRLVPVTPSAETIHHLEWLLDEARAGRVVGIAYAVMHKVNDWSTGAAGECKRRPTMTRGYVAALSDQLAAMPEQA